MSYIKRTETVFDDIQGMSYDVEISVPEELNEHEISLSFDYIENMRGTGVMCSIHDKEGNLVGEDYDTDTQSAVDRVLAKLGY